MNLHNRPHLHPHLTSAAAHDHTLDPSRDQRPDQRNGQRADQMEPFELTSMPDRGARRSSRLRFAAATFAVAALTVGCSSSDGGSESDDGAADVENDVETGVENDVENDVETDEESGDGGASATVESTGVLRIDGVAFEDMEGECEILRGSGTEDVGDLSTPGLSVIVAFDNVDVAGDVVDDIQNFTMTNEDTFRIKNQSGTIESMTEVDDRVSDGSRDIVTVRFTGAFDDGGAVEADFPCVLQNEF